MANPYTLTQFTSVDITSMKVDEVNELILGQGITFNDGIKCDMIQSATAGTNIVINGLGGGEVQINDILLINEIDERTANQGVTVANLLIEDGSLQYNKGSNVTQITSLVTSVTSNNVAGQITTVSSTLAANTSATFTCNNSFCLNTSYVQLQLVSYSGTQGGIVLMNSSINNGSFDVTIRNTDAALAQNGIMVIKFFLL